MATDQSSSYHHYYQIVSKFRRKNSDSRINLHLKNETTQAAATNKRTKMKKSSKFFPSIENKSRQTTSALRRRFSLFRQPNRPRQTHEFEQIIDQLTDDLQKKTTEVQLLKGDLDHNRTHNLEQAMQIQTTLHAKFEEMRRENELLKKSIEELEYFAQRYQTPNSPGSTEPSNSIIKTTNFTDSIPIARSEVRHKTGIEIEVKQDKPQPLKAPISTPSYRPAGLTNPRIPTFHVDENSFSPLYQTPKRRFPPQTPSSNDQIQQLLRELTDCQAIIKQQEQQLLNGKKERDQLCLIVDERANELRNLKQKNEQLEQMIRNEREHSNDEKKLILRVQEERDHLLNQQRQNYERMGKFEEQIHDYESDATKMRDHILCSKIKLDKKNDENLSLINELTDMKQFCRSLEEENQKLKNQINYERTKTEEVLQLKASLEIELEKSAEKLRTQRYEYENKFSALDQSFKSSQKQCQRTIEEKYDKEMQGLKEHIRQLEGKIEEVIQDKALLSIRCGELLEDNRKLEKAISEKDNDYQEKIHVFKEKNSIITAQIDEMEKKLIETKKELELVTLEKDETLSDMLVAVRVASELRYDAEDRLNKANDDLKRVTEHIEHERRQTEFTRQLSPTNRTPNGDTGQVKIKEMIRTLEANSANHSRNKQPEPILRQRPVSQPCTRTEAHALFIHKHQRAFNPPTDDGKILSSTKNDSPSLNHSHRSDVSIRSITNEQYEEMKSIVEAVFARMPGSVCKRDALLKWCVERLANYGISITNFSNSWTDGIAFCCLLHSYLPDRIDLEMIKKESKKKRFEVAFNIASSVGIVSILDIEEMCSSEWPDWERVMYYVALIFRHFESSIPNPALSPILPIPQAASSPMSPSFSNASSPSLCASVRTTTSSIPTILCSPLQTV